MSKIWINATFIILVILSIEWNFGKTIRFPQLRNARTHWNPKYFSNFTILIRNNSLFASIDVLKALQKGFKSHIEVQIRLTDSKSFQTLFTYNLDICKVVISLKNSIFKKWFQSMLKAGNLMQTCPIYVGHYYLNGWKLETDLIPIYLYAGSYRIKSYTFYGKFKGRNEEVLVELDLDIDLVEQ